ncbi:peptidase inhibitor family I36 protein [Streptomyces vinaceus]|uniref:peptidase inhibitor family I36 protein n=1 Tax=Streptomyces vinaceus TaxID=1960 RepID=UPI0036C1E21B
MAAALAAAALPLAVPGAAQADSAFRVKQGQGLDACKAGQFCLYEHENYNASGPARVWIFVPVNSNGWDGWNFKGRPVADKGEAAVNNLAKYDVRLYDNWTEPESTDFILMHPLTKLPSLNNVSGRKIRHDGHYHDGRPKLTPYAATVNLNNRLGSVTATRD